MPADRLDLLLIRHGVTDWNEARRLMGRAPVCLNARGRAQAEAVGAALRQLRLDAIYTSPQQRAQETAHAIASVTKCVVHTDTDLDEVWLTDWQGRTWTELRDNADVRGYLADPLFPTPVIEAASAVQERVRGVLERVRNTHPEGVVALVSHGDPIRILLAYALSIELAHYRRLVSDTGSVSVLRYGSSGCHLLLSNWRPHRSLHELIL